YSATAVSRGREHTEGRRDLRCREDGYPIRDIRVQVRSEVIEASEQFPVREALTNRRHRGRIAPMSRPKFNTLQKLERKRHASSCSNEVKKGRPRLSSRAPSFGGPCAGISSP